MANVYEIITERIVAQLNEGIIPWEKPWVNTSGNNVARSHNDGRIYSVLNQMLLGIPGEYITFKQVEAANGKIKKGAHQAPIFFWSIMSKERKDKDGNVKMGRDGNPMHDSIPFLKFYKVFHIEDTEGIKPKYVVSSGPVADNILIDEIEVAVQEYVGRAGLTLRHYEQGKAYYSPAHDEVIMPHMSQFHNAESYYAALFHELAHSTGAKKRLDRLGKKGMSFGSEVYSQEELVAEISSAVLCNHFGIDTAKVQRNTAAYIQNWLKVLQNDTKMVAGAAGKAEKAVKMILGLLDTKKEDDGE